MPIPSTLLPKPGIPRSLLKLITPVQSQETMEEVETSNVIQPPVTAEIIPSNLIMGFVIEDNIPITSKKTGPRINSILSRMLPGQSILASEAQKKKLWSDGKALGIKIVCRMVDRDKRDFRVWVVE
jgi:hypothetical protein